jgi:hypothetical protein
VRRTLCSLLAAFSDEQVAKLDRLLVLDASVNMTSFAWLKAMLVAPKADHIRELLDRLRRVRDIGLPPPFIGSLSFVIPLLPLRWVVGGVVSSSLVGANGGGYPQVRKRSKRFIDSRRFKIQGRITV